MEQNLEETTPAANETVEAEKPVRRRASRRASTAAGAAAEVTSTVAETVPGTAEAAAAPATDATPAEGAPAETPVEKSAPKRASRARKKVADAESPVETSAADAAPAPAAEETAASGAPGEAPAEAPAAKAAPKRASRARKKAADVPAEPSPAEPAQAVADADAPAATAETESAPAATAAAEAQADAAETTDAPARRSRRRSNAAAAADGTDEANAQSKDEPRGRGRGSRGSNADAKGADAKSDDEAAEAESSDADRTGSQQDRSDSHRDQNGQRSSRTRQRDRKRRGQDDLEPEIAEDDVLLPIAGILDVLDNYAFVRTSGYLPGVSDVYVALGQVKKYGLRRGDAIVGAIRQPREGDNNGRQKYNAIVKIDSVNGKPVEEAEKRADIAEMTPVFPEQALRFAGANAKGLGKAIDEAAPMGLGQRAIVALPARIPASGVLAQLANAVKASAPEAHLMLVLTNARPEDATHLQRTVAGEVITATFDRAAEDQVTIAELAIDRARRLVELGHDVVVLLDSLTDLAEAYVQGQQGTRTTLDASQVLAIGQVKRLLSAARNVENGGSLTLVATARTKSGIAFDKQLLREISPAANSFVKVSGTRTAPEVDAEKSYTLSL